MNIGVLIVDDEPLARRGIRARLKAFPDFTILEDCADGKSGLDAIHRLSPDLVFLDVQMPEMSGFEMIEHLSQNRMPFIIFLTAYDQYALQAFEVHALDYLLKPIDDERFVAAVTRAHRQIEIHNNEDLNISLRALLAESASIATSKPYAERFAIRNGTRISFVLADEIDWIEASGDYASLHVGKKTHLLRETLNSLEARLDPGRFVRIHRSAIVQGSRIREMEAMPNREFRLRLFDGIELKVSRSYSDRLDRWMTR